VEISGGVITVSNAQDDFALYEGFENLRGAFRAAVKAHFPPNGILPPENFFVKPQYNTWAELIYDQNQENILSYAHGIVDNGYPAGILMIDDGWMRYYGSREFNLARFPDARAMMDELHALNFEVMLWICPFISPDSPEFRYLSSKGYLVCNADGSVAIRSWWNGYSAVLDLSNPGCAEWFDEVLGGLMELGADGFKFDAGDVYSYRDDDRTYGGVSAHDQCELWAKLGLKYRYNEYRATYKCAGLPLVERLCDKSHRWESVARLIPDALLQGIMGYPYVCPDMIGGGSFTDFLPGAPSLKPELFARYAQVSALMPMMQYSAAPWRVLDEEHAEYCRAAGRIHVKFADKIIDLARHASVTGEPIMRYMEYVFPHQGFEDVTDVFMLGDDVLVAPVVENGARTRKVRLPDGEWEYVDGTVYHGGETEVPAPMDVLPCFVKK
jgi:alpha-glucosidase (family GH31 glycosyl hydrolase)